MHKIIKPITTSQNSSSVRINLIYNGLHFPKQNYILGIGAGNIYYFMKNYGIYPTKEIVNMHNYWVEILVDYGAIIFIFFIISYFKALKQLVIQYYKNEDKNASAIYLTFIYFVFGFLIACISSSNNITKEWLWILAGIILSFINVKNVSEVKVKSEK